MSPTQEWYIRKDGVRHGPASVADLRALIEAKRITLQQEASPTQEGPWRPLSDYAEFAPIRPISELFGTKDSSQTPQPIADSLPATKMEPPVAPHPSNRRSASPTAHRLLSEALVGLELTQTEREEVMEGLAAETRRDEGPLTPEARAEFRDGLTAEIRKNIGDKPIIWACVVWILVIVLVAGLNKILALVLASGGAAMVFKFVKVALEKKYLQPIHGYSDEMLVARFNEVKADRRAARMRAAIGWAVVVIIAVLLTILFLAGGRQQ